MPPGPWPPPRNLALYDKLAGSVLEQGYAQAWSRETGHAPSRSTARTRGLRPILDLRLRELQGLDRLLEDPTHHRVLALLTERALEAQIAADPEVRSISRAIYDLRAEALGGTEALRGRTLIEAVDPADRRETWEDRVPVARELAPMVRRLAEARNAWARGRGASDYWHFMRTRRGYQVATAERLRRRLEGALSELERRPLRTPWDAEGDDPALARRLAGILDAEGCLDRGREFLESVGLPREPASLTVALAAEDAPFWPYAHYPVDPPDDVRILLAPGAGIYPHWSTMHEFGHAAQALLAPGSEWRLLRRPGSPAVSESAAKLAERLVYAPEWLRRQGAPEEVSQRMAAWERASEIGRMGNFLALTHLEEELYADPQGNLDTAYAREQARLAGVDIPFDVPAWALDRGLVFDPFESWDYVLARCAQAQIFRRLRGLPGGLLGEQARRVLREEALIPAAGERFEAWVGRATGGETIDCAAWLEDVADLEMP